MEASWHNGAMSDSNGLPFFSCRAVGEVLEQVMKEHPHKEMTVLCGHTHGEGYCRILPNLEVFTGGAVYGSPGVQGVLQIP